jgi:hypothetical protein
MRIIRDLIRYKLNISMFFADLLLLSIGGIVASIFIGSDLNFLMIVIYVGVCSFVFILNFLINGKGYFDKE